MCLAALIFFILNAVSALFSFAWLVILPVCGVAFGAQAFSSLSVAVTTSLVARKLIPRLIKQCIPFLELMVTMSALVFPLVYIPPWVCQVNLTLLALLDPFFIIIEGLQMLSFVRWCNVKAQTGIDNQPVICKVAVLSFAIVSWISSLFLLLSIFQGSDTRLLAAFLVLTVLAHAACVYVDSGIISDAALVLLISLLLIRLGSYETKIHETLCTVVLSNHPEPWSGTLLGMLSALPSMTAGAMSRTLSAMGSLTSPLFWIGVLVRVVLVVPALLRLCSLREAGSEGASLDRAAATAIGLVAYTQALWRHLDGCRLLHCTPAMTRPAQALLLTLAYTVQALWEQHGRHDDW
ncbi:uncharacterized protein LOC119389337 [Rhipicephalus sanguineus]|uniref:uncharacterized protein LOC119389337 n=1 Tax=Rhipicephalus sanguineus TaxID=34632 RepID=UPI001894CCF0|nr:uncharacterized protein LOC119389337 [Rhipicephalus sanguineus]